MNDATQRKQVLVFRELPPDQLTRLQAAHNVTVANPRVPEQAAAFHATLPGAHGLIGSSVAIDAALLARAPNLEVISARPPTRRATRWPRWPPATCCRRWRASRRWPCTPPANG